MATKRVAKADSNLFEQIVEKDSTPKANPFAHFVYMDDAIKALELAYKTNRNVILYGRGGYGKSEVTETFFKSKGIEPFVLTMGSGTTPDKLLGGTDISHFIGENPTGKIEYLLENSMFNHEYVVLEELFDAPAEVLEILKDILSSKIVRNGSQQFPIKTKCIVCCTNKTREEFAKNNSLKALLERFPYGTEVKWLDHTRTNYDYLFKVSKGIECPLISYLCEKLHAKQKTISPRIALVALDTFFMTKNPKDDQPDVDALAIIEDFGTKSEIKSLINDFGKYALLMKYKTESSKVYAEYQEYTKTGSKDVVQLTSIVKKYKDIADKYNKEKVSDELSTDYAEIKKMMDNNLKSMNEYYLNLKNEEKAASLLDM